MAKQKQAARFVVCVANNQFEDLEVRKIYQVMPDEVAAEDRMIRVIDESGEDYLYPSDLFVSINLPQAVEKALVPAA